MDEKSHLMIKMNWRERDSIFNNAGKKITFVRTD